MFKSIRSLRTKMLIAVGSASLLVACALGIALYYMQQISSDFHRFLDVDQTKLQAYSEMYAQGLQGGQALRNIVLDPNVIEKASKNLQIANTAFDQSFATAMQLTANDIDEQAALKSIKDDWEATQIAKEKVRSLAKDKQAEAIIALNKEETPNWRKVRETLLKMIDVQRHAVSATRARIADSVKRAWILSLIFGSAAIFLGGLLVIVVSESVRRSLDAVRQSMVELAHGEGDLTRRMPVTAADEVGRTSSAFNEFMGGLQSMIQQMRENADEVASAAAKLSHSANEVSEASHTQSDAASSAAAAVEEMTVSVAHVADSAEHVRKLSQDSYDRTQNGKQSLSRLVGEIESVRAAVNDIANAVTEFMKSTNAITGMTKEVKDIADQTNLLALNAAIEAARAGEQGRGFAVVADEVRKLAEKSATSATEIDSVTRSLGQQSIDVERSIQRGLGSLETSEEMLESVAGMFGEVSDAVSDANAGVDSITRAVKEHTLGSTEISRHMERIAQMAEQNSHVIEQTSRHATQLEGLASSLRGMVVRFKV
jgi:methyl-accepting chemotaxis protein